MQSVLEVCIDSAESAIAATNGGATRLELCGHLILGGVTPTLPLLNEVQQNTHLPINVLCRPRSGDFLYDKHDFAILMAEVEEIVQYPINGIVIGCLQSEGQLNLKQMKKLIEIAHSKEITLHRAFDVAQNPFETLEQAIDLGIHTILTSGQQSNCINGKKCLQQLIEKANERIQILIGSGVNAQVILELSHDLHARQFHLSGKKTIPSSMQFRRENVPMGFPGFSEFERYQTDENEIRKAADALFR